MLKAFNRFFLFFLLAAFSSVALISCSGDGGGEGGDDGVTNAVMPNITAHPQGASYTQGATAIALSVTASSTDGGNISYQWYSNTANSNSGGMPISGATGSTYSPPTTTVGTIYYYAVVINTNNSVNGNTTANAATGAAAIIVTAPGVTNAVAPNITAHPQSASYAQGATATALSVAAASPDGGAISYQWYSNAANSNSGGTLLSGAIASTHTPPTATIGITYYYVVITNTNNSVNGNTTASIASNTAEVAINPLVNAVAPNITVHPQSASYAQGDMATALSVTASSADGGNISYQWYSNTAKSNSGGTLLSGATGSTYTPPTDTVVRRYYYAVVTNTNSSVNGNTTASIATNAATVIVTTVGGVIYTVSFYDNGTLIPEFSGQEASGTQISFPAPTKIGYTFDRWFLNGINEPLAETYTVTEDAVFIAKWTSNRASVTEYTVFFYDNGFVIPEISGAVESGTEITLPSLTKTGYTFDGWLESFDHLFVDETVSPIVGAYTVTGNRYFLAQFTATDSVQHTVSYYDEAGYKYPDIGGIVNSGDVITMPTRMRKGYTFNGWVESDEFLPVKETYTVTDDISFYADFTLPGAVYITTAEELYDIRDNLSGKYILADNISLFEYSYDSGWEPIGTQSAPFTGVLDGNGFEITELDVDRDVSGLFGYIGSGAVINNLIVEVTSVKGISYAGGLAGSIGGTADNRTIISNVHIRGAGVVQANRSSSGNAYVGGISGYLNDAILLGCSNDNEVASSSSDYSYSGGIVGEVGGTVTIANCYNNGDVSSYGSSGGIVGLYLYPYLAV